MPWVNEILETEGRIINTPQGRMHVSKPTKIRIRWVEEEIEETEVVHSNWQMIRPWFACVQPSILDPILDFDADPEMIL